MGKEYVKAVHCYPAYITYRQSASCGMLDESQSESRLLGEISKTSDLQMTSSSWEKAKRY